MPKIVSAGHPEKSYCWEFLSHYIFTVSVYNVLNFPRRTNDDMKNCRCVLGSMPVRPWHSIHKHVCYDSDSRTLRSEATSYTDPAERYRERICIRVCVYMIKQYTKEWDDKRKIDCKHANVPYPNPNIKMCVMTRDGSNSFSKCVFISSSDLFAFLLLARFRFGRLIRNAVGGTFSGRLDQSQILVTDSASCLLSLSTSS